MTSRRPNPFRAHLLVRFGDIDEAGFVYYPRLVHYFHVAMEEFFANVLGVDYPTFLAEHRLGLPTARLEDDHQGRQDLHRLAVPDLPPR
jgi:4-hydroxybenzoyl-CoA thioesterase